MRLRMTHLARRRRPMNAIMFLREIDPNDANRVPRPRLNLSLIIRGVSVPEELRVVVEYRIRQHSPDLPIPNRKGIMLAANRGHIKGKDLSLGVDSCD